MEAYQQLEHELARWIGTTPDKVVACSSGTAALHLALEAFDLQGRRIFVPDYTMVACARACTLADMEPVFIDCDYDLLMDWKSFCEALDDEVPAAVMPVHVYGRRCGMDWIIPSAGRWGGKVIEDMAEIHGVNPHPESDAACWSFYKNKIVAGEEGGAAAFKETHYADRARCLRSLGFTELHDFMHIPRGHNYRLANCLAEKILASLAKVETTIFARRQLEVIYDHYCPLEWRMPPREAPWVYDLRIRGMIPRQQDHVVYALQDHGIAARHGFKPMTKQQEYNHHIAEIGQVSHEVASEIIYLPIQPGVTTENQIATAFEVLRKTFRDYVTPPPSQPREEAAL